MYLSVDAIRAADARIAPYRICTPVEYSPWLSQETGAEVWLKLEHVQTTGSFKLRGAANKLLQLSAELRKGGVITASTGNHGAAVAYMGQKLGIPVTVYVPETIAPTKVAYLELYQAEIHRVGQDTVEAEVYARRMADEAGKPFISPYNDAEVVAGQGTIGIELAMQVPNMDAVLAPVGGGGMISGIATYLKAEKPTVEVIGCQPIQDAVMYHSIQAGQIVEIEGKPTLSDGTAGGLEPDSLTFEICRDQVDRWALVSEDALRDGLRFLLEKHYWMVEGAAALSVASLRKLAPSLRGKKVVLILCGRKMGLAGLKELLSV